MSRKGWDIDFLKMAYLWSQRSTCPRLSVGAVLVKNREVKTTAYNGAPKGVDECTEVGCRVNEADHCTKALHAEQNVIIFSQPQERRNATIYVTHSTCYDCQKMIINSGINRIVYSESYKEDYELARSQGIQIDHIPLKEEIDNFTLIGEK